MSAAEDRQKLEELEAGRILGNLEAEEWVQLAELEERLGGTQTGPSFEEVAARLDGAPEALSVPIPSHLEEQLQASLRTQSKPAAVKTPGASSLETIPAEVGSTETKVNETPFLLEPQVAWFAAAACLVLTTVTLLRNGADEQAAPLPDRSTVAELRAEADDGLIASFAGPEDGRYADMKGEVLWSTEKQDGYLTLSGLPANDPRKEQYQLWIVDPDRDVEPVDGGVFDVTNGETVVRIDEKLRVLNPAAFVITLEKPGGVVVSEQEVVVAIAKATG